MATAFVTGGSGFIGNALIRRLVADGHTVSALARSDVSARAVEDAGARAVRGELLEPESWTASVDACDVVFHLAAETDVAADPEQHQRVTVDGTRAALEGARRLGAAHFVHCGSEAALLAGPPLIDVDETAPLRPDSPAAYSAAKAQSEQLVAAASDEQLATVVIRPRFVWGPGSNLIDAIVRAARNGTFAWIEGSRFPTDVTYIDNVVEGLVLGWQRGRPGEAYFITDREPVEMRSFLEKQFQLYKVDLRIPDLDLETARANVPPPLFWFFSQQCTLKTGKAVEELGYRPVITRDQALATVAAAWLTFNPDCGKQETP
ncbi:NAD-dependent epimerase/dehydratase family protein [Amycolatopsis sp. NPDC051371]|uniref:NAD-dependent epimerase/dehydratase family protein n=1 Tax=Amycolatopsis sp. NPDC051371 TaxID=3155800 RepID=UPI003433F5F1